ncbi:MAG: hypothetical protein WD023_09630 [Ilumatobacteraceae bacterium]
MFELSSPVLLLMICAIVGSTIAIGIVVGRRLRARSEAGADSLGVVQGALLGLVGLLLAFGLSMAVSRYETRRVALVAEANTIGTTYLRAQLLAEPERTASLDILREYGDAAVAEADVVPDTDEYVADVAAIEVLQNDLWALAGDAVTAAPQDTAPKLYVETLNEMIDAHGNRVASLSNRVPATVVLVQVLGSAVALGVLAMYLALLGRGLTTSLLAGAFVVLILFVSFDLDRPRRGFITVPSTALVNARAAMDEPPAAGP